MSSFAQTMALHLPLPVAESKVLQIIADECRDKELRCTMAHTYLAQLAGHPKVKGCSPRTVTRMVARLAERQLIEIDPTDGKQNAYRLKMENWWAMLPEETLRRFGAWAMKLGMEPPDTLASVARVADTLAKSGNEPLPNPAGTLAKSDTTKSRTLPVGPAVAVLDEKQQGPRASAPDLPPGVTLEAWNGWVEVRRKIPRAPFTVQAEKVALTVLRRKAAAGENVARLLERATVGAWKGFDADPRPGAGGGTLRGRSKQHPVAALGQGSEKPAPGRVAEATPDNMQPMWATAKGLLRSKIASEDAEAWLEPLQLIWVDASCVVLDGLPNSFFRSRLLTQYRDDLLAVLTRAFPGLAFDPLVQIEARKVG